MKKLNILFVLAALSLSVAGCNTIEGLGKDAKAAGQKISSVASDSKGY